MTVFKKDFANFIELGNQMLRPLSGSSQNLPTPYHGDFQFKRNYI